MPSKIEWTDETWNPITGCTKISAGCKNCYAERMARRLAGRYGYPEYPDHFKVTLHPDRLEEPLHWRKPRMVFVCSMSDLFHEDVPSEFIKRDVWNVMVDAKQHVFQILTKRPARMLQLWRNHTPWPENIWCGVTAENQVTADERIPLLLQVPAAVRFVSCEPLLGAVDLRWYLGTGELLSQNYLDWVIIGSESGPRRRNCDLDWVRSLTKQCLAGRVSVFVKQLSINAQLSKSPSEWPVDLRIREFPAEPRQ